jgi:hypothetical protein
VAPFMATYNTLDVLVRTWSLRFVLFWMKSNGSPMMVLNMWLTKPLCRRRGVLEGTLDTPWKWIE